MDSTQWAQGIGLLKKPLMEEGGIINNSSSIRATTLRSDHEEKVGERKAIRAPASSSLEEEKKKKKEVRNCPRCNSTNTKFCYYNNYSLTQPRYFCKTCRRYWTEGGSLRNVPVGGGSRKNKKHSSNPSSSSSTKMILQPPQSSNYMLHPFDHQVQDLNLSFLSNNNNNNSGGPILGIPMTMPAVVPDHDMFPFEGGRRLLFPFGEMKQQDQQHMFWNNGMMGSGEDGSW